MTFSLPNPRYERKFVVQGLDLTEVIALVRRHPALFREPYPPRVVNNWYLDSPGLTDYHDHVNGAANRMKTRVRWYGQNGGDIAAPVLERKPKRGQVGGKTAFPLRRISVNGNGIGAALSKAFAQAQMPDNLRSALTHLQPSLYNCYRRRYFVSADGRFRLTVDSELQSRRLPAGPGGLIRWPGVVLEVKFAPEHAEAADKITNPFPFRLARCSKYILGLEHCAGV